MLVLPAFWAAVFPSQDPQTLLNEVRDVYSKVTTAKYRVKFETTDPKMHKLAGTAEVWFLREHNIKVVLSGLEGKPKTLFCNGKSITISPNPSRKSIPFSVESLSHSLPLNLETFAFLDWKHELSTSKGGGMSGSVLTVKEVSWHDRSWTVLEELNKADDSLDQYFIGKDDHIVWRVVDMSADAKTVFSDTQVSSLVLGEPIPESTFENSNS